MYTNATTNDTAAALHITTAEAEAVTAAASALVKLYAGCRAARPVLNDWPEKTAADVTIHAAVSYDEIGARVLLAPAKTGIAVMVSADAARFVAASAKRPGRGGYVPPARVVVATAAEAVAMLERETATLRAALA